MQRIVTEKFSPAQRRVAFFTNDPPLPALGQRLIVGENPTQTFAGHQNDIAFYHNGWIFDTPVNGWRVWVDQEACEYIFIDNAWVKNPIPVSISNKNQFSHIYGLLYNYHAVLDYRELAPEGYHIMSSEELDTILTIVGESLGSHLDIISPRMHPMDHPRWEHFLSVITNSTGFSALPNGYRDGDENNAGAFEELGYFSTLWIIDPNAPYGVSRLDIGSSYFSLSSPENDIMYGFGVRCIRDNLNGYEHGEQVIDIDGNLYDTVLIGGMAVMVQNLCVTRFRNGDPIAFQGNFPNVFDNREWIEQPGPAYCSYDNNPSLSFLTDDAEETFSQGDSLELQGMGLDVSIFKEPGKLILKLSASVLAFAVKSLTDLYQSLSVSLSGFISTVGENYVPYNQSKYHVNLNAKNLTGVNALQVNGSITAPGHDNFRTNTTQINKIIASRPQDIAQSPMGKYLWHDMTPFDECNVNLEISLDGNNWAPGTLDRVYFNQKEDQSGTVINSLLTKAVRWTWTSRIQYSQIAWVVIGHTWNSGTNSNKTILIESSSDGINWIERHLSTYNTCMQAVWHWIPPLGADTLLRLTITHNSGGDVNISTIRLMSPRWGNQGRGSEYTYPYDWNKDKDINIKRLGIGLFPSEALEVDGIVKASGYKTGAATGQTTTVTVVTDVSLDDDRVGKKYQVLTFTNGLLTAKSVESGWEF